MLRNLSGKLRNDSGKLLYDRGMLRNLSDMRRNDSGMRQNDSHDIPGDLVIEGSTADESLQTALFVSRFDKLPEDV